MSGIAAIVDLQGRRADEGILRGMLGSMRHRAIDGEGVWCEGPAALAHATSATTDEDLLATQPFHKGGLTITFDGRLDNREELCERLGLECGAASDAEIVLEAYRVHGDGCCARLLGDFAFALWDAPNARLFCARDQLAVCPFYYAVHAGIFRCASEMQPLFADRSLPKRPNRGAIAAILVMEFGDCGETLYEGVLGLAAGQRLIVERGRVAISAYHDFGSPDRIRYRDERDYPAHFRSVLQQSVRSRLRARHRISAQLSGGLDSSSVATIASQLLRHEGRPAPLLCHMTAPRETDEREFGQAVADRLNLPLTVVEALEDPDDAKIDLAKQRDDVLYSATQSGGERLYRAATQAGSRVLLTGQGSDQIMCRTRLEEIAALSGGELRVVGRALGLGTGAPLRARDLAGASKRIVRQLIRPALPRPLENAWTRIRAQRARWLTSRARWKLSAYFDNAHRDRHPHSDPAIGDICGQLRDWNLGASTAHLGRHASAFGLEMRHPFLDRRVFELLLAFPHEQRCGFSVSKPILRRAMIDELPEAVLWRPSFHYGHFYYDVLLEQGRAAVHALLTGSRLAELRLVDEARALALVAGTVRDERRWLPVSEICTLVAAELLVRRMFG